MDKCSFYDPDGWPRIRVCGDEPHCDGCQEVTVLCRRPPSAYQYYR
jgi:hypothetical protein